MPNNLSTPSLPALKKSDLDDATEILLNQNFQSCWNKIIWLAGGSGAINIPQSITAQSFSASAQTNPPSDPNQLITLQTALSLFSPSTTRTALTSGAFQTSPTAVQPAQPLPQSIVSSAPPASSTSPGTPGQLAYDANFLYVCISSGSWRRVATSSF